MTTQINQTPLEAKVREYLSQHNIPSTESKGFQTDKHIPADCRAWVCQINAGALTYARTIPALGGNSASMDIVKRYQVDGIYEEHLKVVDGDVEFLIQHFPITNEYQIITTINKKSSIDVKTSVDDVVKMFSRKEVA